MPKLPPLPDDFTPSTGAGSINDALRRIRGEPLDLSALESPLKFQVDDGLQGVREELERQARADDEAMRQAAAIADAKAVEKAAERAETLAHRNEDRAESRKQTALAMWNTVAVYLALIISIVALVVAVVKP